MHCCSERWGMAGGRWWVWRGGGGRGGTWGGGGGGWGVGGWGGAAGVAGPPGHSLPSGTACPPKPHPRSLSTSWRGRAQRSALLDSGKPAHLGSPSPLRGEGDRG